MKDVPFLERAEASKRFEKSLHWEIFAMLAGGFAGDNYWTECVKMFPESTISFLRCTMLVAVPYVGSVHGMQVGAFTLRDVVARADGFQSVSLPCL